MKHGESMPGYLYSEEEVIERKPNVRVMGNGTCTAGAKYINNPDVRVDIIVVKKAAKVEKVITRYNDELQHIEPQQLPQIEHKPSLFVSRPNSVV